MSDDDRSSESGTTLLTAEYAEYKDGQLQIVDMPPAKRSKLEAVTGHILQVSGKKDNEDLKYVQVLDSDKNVVVDLLNLTLVKCNNGQESYRLVSNDETESGSEETVTCVLSNDDGDEHDSDSYVVMEGDEGPMVFLQSALSQSPPPKDTQKPSEKPAPTPVEILERAKSLQKAKSLMSLHTASAGRGRRRKSQLPPPHELLASPHFKLYLYSCKMCDFKCNAIKELTAHKAAEHAGGSGGGGPGKWRGGGHRASTITLQCARCPFRGNTHPQLMKHVKDKHSEITTVTTTSVGLLESAEVSSADVLVCGACGFECAARDAFKRHIVEEHGVVAC